MCRGIQEYLLLPKKKLCLKIMMSHSGINQYNLKQKKTAEFMSIHVNDWKINLFTVLVNNTV